MKKLLSLLIAAVMLVSICACGSENTNPTQESKQDPTQSGSQETSKEVLIAANKEPVNGLAPYGDTGVVRNRVTMNIYDTLVLANADGTYTPLLAESYEMVDDTHIKFNLRKGVKFSNGNDFNADDVLFTLQYAVSEKSGIADTFASIDVPACTKEDDYTVIVALKSADATVLGTIGSPGYTPILDKETCEADYDAMATKPVGTGAYMVKEFIIGDAITLAKNPYYWGKEAIIDEVIIRPIAETAQRSAALQNGEVDVVYDLSVLDVPLVESLGTYKVVEEAGLTVHNLYFNGSENHPLANLNLRKAVALAINKEDIVLGGYEGNARVATSFASSAAVGYSFATKGTECFPQDIEGAKKALADYYAETGTNEVTIRFVCDNNAYRSATVTVVQKALEDIGIKVDTTQTGLDFGTALNTALNAAGDWDIYLLGNGETSVLTQAKRFSKTDAPFLAVKDPEMEDIFNKMKVCSDANQLNGLYTEIYDKFLEKYVCIPYCEELVFMAHPANLEGFEIYNASGLFFQNMSFK